MLRSASRELERRRPIPYIARPQQLVFARLLSNGRCFLSAYPQAFAVTRDRAQVPSVAEHQTFTHETTTLRHATSGDYVEHRKDLYEAHDNQNQDPETSRSLISKHWDEERLPRTPAECFKWNTVPRRRRRVERDANLAKSWMNQSPNILLKRILQPDKDSPQWRRSVARARSMRLPIILLQMLIQRQELQSAQDGCLLDLLPNEQEWAKMMRILSGNGHTPDRLDHYLHILQGRNDDERCERFLQSHTNCPIFLFNFLIRPSSQISNPTILKGLIKYCESQHQRGNDGGPADIASDDTSQRQTISALRMSTDEFRLVMSLLARHCHRIEPRLLITQAEVIAKHIENLTNHNQHPQKTFKNQCRVFNEALKALQPQTEKWALQRAVPNAYFWEAQKVLLSMSSNFEKPLQVNVDGFRSIRAVLSGLSKNQAEIHSSFRHAATWPPYLLPGDGMDESSDPEENWTRTVQAGMLMQEAGFGKDERDDAIDVLQGAMPDGTPTIQQRAAIGDKFNMEVWEASIRSTRNPQEAWERFQNPPSPEVKPNSAQYAAMFEKLILREAASHGRHRPGDKALNFPTHVEANLAEFERARRRPPSVAQLYQRMRLGGVRPQGSCLRVLVANADSLDTAHQYLRDSPMGNWIVRVLSSEDPDPTLLKRVGLGLFSAYIQVCSRLEGRRAARHIMRAIRITSVRLEFEHSRWVPFIWGSILKNLSQHHRGLRVSLPEQLSLLLDILERIDARHGVSTPVFIQFCKCIRKACRREMDDLLVALAAENPAGHNALQLLYDWKARDATSAQEGRVFTAEDGHTSPPQVQMSAHKTPLYLFSMSAIRMKQLFNILCSQEKETQRLLEAHNVSPLEQMACRNDPVRSEQAYEYMLSLAYVGEFKEMAKLMKWLIEEWGQADLVEAIDELSEPPGYADFLDTLCAFRLLGEPMLDESEVASVQESIGAARLHWTWPDDEAVETYANMQDDASTKTLGRVLERVRHRQGLGRPDT